jgi:translocator protein
MLHDKLRQSLNFCFALSLPVIATLVNMEVTGPSMGAISGRYPTYVVPAGYAFSIWSLIFALALAYAIWQALPRQRENLLLRRVGWFTASAFAASSVWMLVFQRLLFALSLAVMLWLLASLIGVVARLYQYGKTLSKVEQWLIHVTFSIYLGWITAATVANVGQVLAAFEWSGWGVRAEIWGVLALSAAGTIASAVTVAMKGNAPYALTVIWAMIAVAVNQFTRSVPTNSTTVGVTAIGVALLVGITALINRRDAWRLSKPMYQR